MPAHIIKIAEAIQGLIDNQYDRLLISLPPRHSKTQSCTIRLAAWFLENYPEDNVLITSYSERLARRFSRMVRTIFGERNKIANDKTATDEWSTIHGGTLMARGTGNPATGQGFSLIIADDPIKSREEAESLLMRDKTYEWFTSDVISRLEPGGKLILVMTRWHEDDVAGRAILQEPNAWKILTMPALADDENDPLGRQIGEALWPERYDREALLRLKSTVGEYAFQALYQCQPSAKQGSLFKINELKYIDAVPNNLVKIVRSYDLAATENGGDYTVGAKVGIDENKNIYILDILRGQWSPEVRDRYIKNTADSDGRILITLPEDPGSAGKFQTQYLFRLLSGNNISKIRPTTKKELRAEPFASQLNVGNVYIVKADWNKALVEELRTFPSGKNDDQIDACSDAFATLFVQSKFQAF